MNFVQADYETGEVLVWLNEGAPMEQLGEQISGAIQELGFEVGGARG